MADVHASIDLRGIAPSGEESNRFCLMFLNPHVFIHGTREEIAEFTRQIREKAGLDG